MDCFQQESEDRPLTLVSGSIHVSSSVDEHRRGRHMLPKNFGRDPSAASHGGASPFRQTTSQWGASSSFLCLNLPTRLNASFTLTQPCCRRTDNDRTRDSEAQYHRAIVIVQMTRAGMGRLGSGGRLYERACSNFEFLCDGEEG
jgi:hypothetical protein